MGAKILAVAETKGRRFGRFQRVTAALILAAGFTGAVAMSSAIPAGATYWTADGTPYIDCINNPAWGQRSLQLGLSGSPVTGTTWAIYLYKWVWNGSAWTTQYQNAMDWAKKTNIGGWSKGGEYKDRLFVEPAGSGYYFVKVAFWAPNGSYSGYVWSGNNCTF